MYDSDDAQGFKGCTEAMLIITSESIRAKHFVLAMMAENDVKNRKKCFVPAAKAHITNVQEVGRESYNIYRGVTQRGPTAWGEECCALACPTS